MFTTFFFNQNLIRYIIVGTKEGYLKILDTVSSKVIWNELAHEGGVVWSLAVRPDGQGFMSGGSDKLVKFWDFVLDNSAAGLGAGECTYMHAYIDAETSIECCTVYFTPSHYTTHF